MRTRHVTLGALCILVLLGAGCSRTTATKRLPQTAAPTGDIKTQFLTANIVPGVEVSSISPASARRLYARLGPPFSDQNGTYPGLLPGQLIRVNVGFPGSSEEERDAIRSVLVRPQEWSVDSWRLIGGTDMRAASTTVIFATLADPDSKLPMYHAIMCTSGTAADQAFWDGCRTFIETARITAVPGEILNTK